MFSGPRAGRYSSLEAEGQIKVETALHKLQEPLNHCSSAALSPPYKLFPFLLRQRVEQQEGEKLRQRMYGLCRSKPTCAEDRSLPLLDIWAAGMRALKAQGRKHSAVFSCFVDLKHSHSKGPRNQGENGGFEGVGVGETKPV